MFIAGLLACSFILAPVSDTLMVQRAQAITTVEVGPIVAFENITMVEQTLDTIANVANEINTSYLSFKECCLDGIAWSLINIVIKEMIRSVTAWVRSGFQGSPAFVTDLSGFLLDIADKVAGNYIYGSALAGLCSPFKLNIKLALDLQYRETRGYVAQCRLSSVIKNIDGFLNGNFLQGGWDGFYNTALIPGNNPYGAMMKAQGGLYASISGAQNTELKILDFGKGFQSLKDQYGHILTPGTTIESSLNNALDLPNKRIAVADEINELMGALFSQLVGQVLGGVGGLLGSAQSQGTSGSYFDQLSAEQNTLGYADTSNKSIDSAISDETRYLGFQNTIVSTITNASTYELRHSPTITSVGTLTSSLASQLSTAQTEVTRTTATIAALTVFRDDYALLQSPTTQKAVVDSLVAKYGATSVPEAQTKLMNQYLQYKAQGLLHSATQVARLQLTVVPGIQEETKAFTDTIDRIYEDSRRGGPGNSSGGD